MAKVVINLTGSTTIATQATGTVINFTSTLSVPPTITIPVDAVGSQLFIYNTSSSAILFKDQSARSLPIRLPIMSSIAIFSDGYSWFPSGQPCALDGYCTANFLPQLRGVNMAGFDIPWQNLPLNLGTNYQPPSTQDIDYIASKGANFIRLVFSWEALQGTLNGSFAPVYLGQLTTMINYITGKGMYCLIEPTGDEESDFAAWKGNKVGSTAVPNSAFANFWSQIAALFATNPYVMFGLSNEPCDMSTVQWFSAAQAAITAIRATGSINWIFLPGNDYTCADTWSSNFYDTASPQVSNQTGVAAVKDPLKRTIISVHNYVDSSLGGTGTDISSATAGSAQMESIVAWARTNGWRLHISEFGVAASNSLAAPVCQDLLEYMNSNEDVIAGISWWADGPPSWWGTYQFTLCPTVSSDGNYYTTDSPQMALAQPFFLTK